MFRARLILILALTPFAAYPRAQFDVETNGNAQSSANSEAAIELEFSFSTHIDIGDEIIDSLTEGHRTEIHYEARIYERNDGIARLFGDQLIAETSVLYVTRWDELNDRYVVTIDGERERGFESSDSLTRFLLSLDDFRITLPYNSTKRIYLLCRAQIEPIRLVPPLTLMTFLLPKFKTTTPWTEVEYRRVVR